MEKEYIQYVREMTQLEGIELHGYIKGLYAYDPKGYGLKDKQPKLFKSLLERLLDVADATPEAQARGVADWLLQAKIWVGESNQNKFDFWVNQAEVLKNIILEKPMDENSFILYLGLNDTPITSSLKKLEKEQIEARGLTEAECESLRIIFRPWYKGTNSSKEWEPSNWAPCPLEEVLCEKLSQLGEDPQENMSRFAKYNFAYESDIFEIEDSYQSGKEGNFIAKMPTEKEATKIGHELADLVNGFDSDTIDFININQDVAEKSITYKWLPADIELANSLHDVNDLSEAIDILWDIAKTKELGKVSKVAWYLCKRYHDIANWQKGFEGKIYQAFEEGLKGLAGPIILKANDFISQTQIKMRVAALAATEKCSRKIVFDDNEVVKVVKPDTNTNIVVGVTVAKKCDNETGVITDVDNTGFDVAFGDESFHYKMENYKKYLKVID